MLRVAEPSRTTSKHAAVGSLSDRCSKSDTDFSVDGPGSRRYLGPHGCHSNRSRTKRLDSSRTPSVHRRCCGVRRVVSRGPDAQAASVTAAGSRLPRHGPFRMGMRPDEMNARHVPGFGVKHSRRHALRPVARPRALLESRCRHPRRSPTPPALVARAVLKGHTSVTSTYDRRSDRTSTLLSSMFGARRAIAFAPYIATVSRSCPWAAGSHPPS